MSCSQSPSPEVPRTELDWQAVFDHSYAHSLVVKPEEAVPHGRLSTSLQETAGIRGNTMATTLINHAVSTGTLVPSSGECCDAYELAPSARTTREDTIPAELREQERWVCWQYHDRSGGKPAKLPLNPRTGTRASPTDPDTWASYDDARAYPDANGIGFVFAADGPYVGVDLDDCVAEDGTVDEWAKEIVSQLASYTEYSPSGTGLHVIVRGEVPGEKHRHGDVEMYDQARYFTVTGDHISDAPITIESRQDDLEAVYADHLVPDTEDTDANQSGTGEPSTAALTHSDEELLEKARGAKDGAQFTRLWAGNTSGYDSHSEADSALCCKLAFWMGGDRERMDRLFRQSGLMRAKWDEARGDRTYGEQTIENALNVVTTTYNPNKMATKSNSNYRNRTELCGHYGPAIQSSNYR